MWVHGKEKYGMSTKAQITTPVGVIGVPKKAIIGMNIKESQQIALNLYAMGLNEIMCGDRE